MSGPRWGEGDILLLTGKGRGDVFSFNELTELLDDAVKYLGGADEFMGSVPDWWEGSDSLGDLAYDSGEQDASDKLAGIMCASCTQKAATRFPALIEGKE